MTYFYRQSMHLYVTLFVSSLMQSFIRPRFAAGGKSLPQPQTKRYARKLKHDKKKKIPSQKKLNFLATAQPTRQLHADRQQKVGQKTT